MTGERLIYKRRGEAKPEIGAPPPLPKKLHFVLDCSASMCVCVCARVWGPPAHDRVGLHRPRH